MPNCLICSKSVTSGFVVCGDCAAQVKERSALKPLYLVFGEDGRWAGGYDGVDLRPLFGGTCSELGESLRLRLVDGEYGYIQLLSSEELDSLREEKGLERGQSAEAERSEWTLTDDDACQYVRSGGDGIFELIQTSLINPDKGQYAVYTGTVNVQEYIDGEPEELNQILGTYGYTGVADVNGQYGTAAKQIIAECIFEYYIPRNTETLFSGTRKKCEQFIRKYCGGQN